ncbi:hypothetical protein HELRODRAFT_168447 [Helobdella robusta]|uniref:BTB domain-containing protein n=1 Tax=Helobdella robusta TaxID=6412 RepID=T1F0L7_HELRO|nr:hypothetical protein HELRODRAFT_168447 [Helobdella robusta]ESO09463.1 hypothetical protein HELRODRAFT_168447 [Helobdella robusta]
MASLNLKPDNMMNGNVNHHATNHLDSFSLTAANEEAKKKQDEGFSVEDQKRRDDILTRMNTMRKEGNLCDAILDVKGQSLSVHRVVLASSCTFFYEMFSLSESRNKRVDTKEPFVLEGMDFESVERIVNYFYTSNAFITDMNMSTTITFFCPLDLIFENLITHT